MDCFFIVGSSNELFFVFSGFCRRWISFILFGSLLFHSLLCHIWFKCVMATAVTCLLITSLYTVLICFLSWMGLVILPVAHPALFASLFCFFPYPRAIVFPKELLCGFWISFNYFFYLFSTNHTCASWVW